MMSLIETRRLNLLEVMGVLFSSQNDIADCLGFKSNQITDWKFKTKEITDDQARKIERELGKPKGWMDRDNNALNLNEKEFELIVELRELKPNVQESLFDLVKAMRNG